MTSSSIIQQATGNFHGGIHPAEYKTISNNTPITSLSISKKITLPLQQNIGQAATPIVELGDTVIKGQLIANNESSIGANLHSPVDGIITAIELCYTGHPSGLFKPAIVITCSGIIKNTKFERSLKDKNNWSVESKNDLLEKINQAGIVGLGGAAFPTQVKLASPSIKTLIVNAMECEPYITCDDRLIREHSSKIIEGAKITAYITGASEIIFASEDNKIEAIKSLEQQIKKTNSDLKISIIVAPTKYPSGGEKQLIELILNKQLPHGQLPSSIGVLVQNIATLYAINDAVINNNPLTQRLVTLTGDLIKKPGNYWIPFGTAISDLMNHFEISSDLCPSVILGGPLMGQKITNMSTPVVKSTNCIIFNNEQSQSKNWVIESKQHQECIRCSDCENACPVNLLPQQLYWHSQTEQFEKLEKQGLFDCIECGACAYVCPSEIPLVHYFRFGKSTIKNNREKQSFSDQAKKRFEFREKRLQRIKDERALKHQKAAEARLKSAQDVQADPSGKQTAINQALLRVKQKKAKLNTNPSGKDE